MGPSKLSLPRSFALRVPLALAYGDRIGGAQAHFRRHPGRRPRYYPTITHRGTACNNCNLQPRTTMLTCEPRTMRRGVVNGAATII
jgi:hypothetical protein